MPGNALGTATLEGIPVCCCTTKTEGGVKTAVRAHDHQGGPQRRRKKVPVPRFSKNARGHTMCWRWAVGGWRLATGGWWRLAAVGGGWRRLVVGDWWLMAVGSGWRLAVGRRWWLAIGGGWRLVAVGGWRLMVPWGGP